MARLTTGPTTQSARRALQTFECRPTPLGLPTASLPDELMLDWKGVPDGSKASIYLPATSADEIAATAGTLYGGQRLVATDPHTLSFDVAPVNYVPVPVISTDMLAGLLTVELAPGLSQGHRCSVDAYQVSTVTTIGKQDFEATQAPEPRVRHTRKVIGGFTLTVRIGPAPALLASAERALAFFRWVLTQDTRSRWRPVIARYVGELANRVDSLGGSSKNIPPSSSGTVPGRGEGRQRGQGTDGGQRQAQGTGAGTGRDLTGKVVELVYDRFGDCEGFVLETDDGRYERFDARESHLCELARWAWEARLRVTVCTLDRALHVPDRIRLHRLGEW